MFTGLNGTMLFSYRIQFERRRLPVRISPRRRSFFELLPWERDGPSEDRQDRGSALPVGVEPTVASTVQHRPGTPRPQEVPSIEEHLARLESIQLESHDSAEPFEKNEESRPTLQCAQ